MSICITGPAVPGNHAKGFAMRIQFHRELPQWITNSDIAAYHPASRTIHLRRDLGWRLIPVLAHELTHWAIHMLGLPETLHKRLDRK